MHFAVQPDLSQRIGLIPTDHTTRAGAVQRLNCQRSANRIAAIVHRPCEICTVSKEFSAVIELEADPCRSGESIRHPFTGNPVHPRTAIPIRNRSSARVPRMDIRRLRRAILQINSCACNRRHHRRITPGDFRIVFRFFAVGCTNPTTSQLPPAQYICTLVFRIRERDVAVAAVHYESITACTRTILRAKTDNTEAETSLIPAGLGRVDGKLASDQRQAFSFHGIGFIRCLPLPKRRLSLRGSHIHVLTDPGGNAIILLSVRSVIAHRDVLRRADGTRHLWLFITLRCPRHQRGNGGSEHHRYRRERSEQTGLHRYGRPAVAPMFHPHRFFPFCSVLPIRADRELL